MTGGRVERGGLVATAPVSERAFREFGTLRDRGWNFEPMTHEQAASEPDWNLDRRRVRLPPEPPGPPLPGATYEVARQLLVNYVFADPAVIRAVYDPRSPLEDRDLLLVGRFLFLRFHMGVRIGGVREGPSVVDGRRVHRIRWHYRTLEGHLERGHMDYRLEKDLETGDVTFAIRAYSQRAHIEDPIIRLGFRLFARRTQLRFYRRSLQRMQRLVAEMAAGATSG